METANKFFIGAHGDDVVFLRPVPQRLSKDDALLLAAWIVAMCFDMEKFTTIYDKVTNT